MKKSYIAKRKQEAYFGEYLIVKDITNNNIYAHYSVYSCVYIILYTHYPTEPNMDIATL